MDELMRPAEVARMLGVSRTWLYAAAADGRIPSVRIGGPGGPVRFVREDLDRWLQEARSSWTPGRGHSLTG
jgi:excisionase family DNA binding protein